MLERTLQQLAPVLVLFLAVFSIVLAQKDLRLPESRVSSRTVDVLEAQLNLTYSASVDRGQEFHFVYTIPLAYEEQETGVRLRVDLNTVVDPFEGDDPLRTSVLFEDGGLVWTVPYEAAREEYYSVERTLLVHRLPDDQDSHEVTVIISTSCATPLDFQILAYQMEDFKVPLGDDKKVSGVSVSTPQYFLVDLSEVGGDDERFLELTVESEEDNVCGMVSLQPADLDDRTTTVNTAPDSEEAITTEGAYQTISELAAFNVDRDALGRAALVAFVVLKDEEECRTDGEEYTDDQDRIKTFTFRLDCGVDKDKVWWLWGSSLIILFVLSLGSFLVAHFFSLYRHKRNIQKMTREIMARQSGGKTEEDANSVSTDSSGSSSSAMSPWYPKSVAELSKKTSGFGEEVVVHSFKQSELYSWLTLTMGLFYGIPALQLVLNHNFNLTDSGDQDICFYNFLCTIPSFNFTNFNNILSNSYYLICGVLFIILTWNRQRQYNNFLRQMAESPPPEDCHLSSMQLAVEASKYGIPQHFGLFYGMGLALIGEGFFSSFYHVCPSKENFQFDTTFMYIMATLSYLKVFQFRHPDITASAYKTFLGIGVVIFIEAIGIFYGTTAYWATTLTIYFLLMASLIGILYHPGQWTFERSLINRFGDSAKTRLKDKRPDFSFKIPKEHAILIVLLILVNLVLLVCGAAVQPNTSSFILNIFIGNLLAYVAYYAGMKIYHKEKLTISVYIWAILTAISVVIALYYYTRGITDSTLTPAESRNGNRECILFDMYDSHDVWHMFSAMGLFFVYMLLLNLDDGVFFTPRSEIKVF